LPRVTLLKKSHTTGGSFSRGKRKAADKMQITNKNPGGHNEHQFVERQQNNRSPAGTEPFRAAGALEDDIHR